MRRAGLAAVMLCATLVTAQNVAINPAGTAPANVALLDLKDNPDKGLLIPRIALQATNVAAPVAAPATGLLVYNTASSGAGQFAVTPGFYLWDAGQRWLRYEAMVRRPAMYNSSGTVVTSAAAWSVISGMVTPNTPLQAGDRVEMRAFGTATSAAVGELEGWIEIAVSTDGGVTYAPLPNGSGNTVFSIDNGVLVIASVSRARSIPYQSWNLTGHYDVPATGNYVFAVRMRRLAGSVGISTGGGGYVNKFLVETIRP